MGLSSLYLSRAPLYFGGVEPVEPRRAALIVMGVPYDATSSYRPGSREAPRAIRWAAANIEFYSPRARLDIEQMPIADLGDLAVAVEPDEAVKRLAAVMEDVAGLAHGRLIAAIGGEHTITLGLVRGLEAAGLKTCLLVLDAHLDLRDSYMDERLSHACVMRRISEEIGPRLVYYGTRAYVGEEARYADEKGIVHLDAVTPEGLPPSPMEVARRLRGLVEAAECKHLHVSIDMDAFDPAYAPGVGNPEPEGLTPREVLQLLHLVAELVAKENLTTSMDVVEVSPPYDPSGITSALAAKTVVEYAAALAARKRLIWP